MKGTFMEQFTMQDMLDLINELEDVYEYKQHRLIDVVIGETTIMDFVFALIEKNRQLMNDIDDLEMRCSFYDAADAIGSSDSDDYLREQLKQLESEIEDLRLEYEKGLMEINSEWSEKFDKEHDKLLKRENQIATLYWTCSTL
jgi:hypothetical protein